LHLIFDSGGGSVFYCGHSQSACSGVLFDVFPLFLAPSLNAFHGQKNLLLAFAAATAPEKFRVRVIGIFGDFEKRIIEFYQSAKRAFALVLRAHGCSVFVHQYPSGLTCGTRSA